VEGLEDPIDDQEQRRDSELSRDIHGNRCALKVLFVRSEDEQQDVGDGNGKQCLFIQPRMGVNEQVIEIELAHEGVVSVIEESGVVAFAQHTSNICRFNARWNQIQGTFTKAFVLISHSES